MLHRDPIAAIVQELILLFLMSRLFYLLLWPAQGLAWANTLHKSSEMCFLASDIFLLVHAKMDLSMLLTD